MEFKSEYKERNLNNFTHNIYNIDDIPVVGVSVGESVSISAVGVNVVVVGNGVVGLIVPIIGDKLGNNVGTSVFNLNSNSVVQLKSSNRSISTPSFVRFK